VRLVNFGHLGDGNLHYNVQAPPGDDAQRFLAEQSTRSTASSTTPWRRFGGSISAEHGVGALKRDELASASRRWRWR
jgi:FAD/FMN-containing dehydrogenase